MMRVSGQDVPPKYDVCVVGYDQNHLKPVGPIALEIKQMEMLHHSGVYRLGSGRN